VFFSLNPILEAKARTAAICVPPANITGLISEAESQHFKAKQILKNQLEGSFFVEERENGQIEFTEHGGPKPTDSYVKARAEARAKPLRKNLIKTHEEMQVATKFWESSKEMINFLKKTLDVQREEYNKAGIMN